MERPKYVDESWKESAEKEKERLAGLTQKQQRPNPQPEPSLEPEHSQETHQETESYEDQPDSSPQDINFLNYISSLIYQTMVFLGELPNPVTNIVEPNYEQAKFLIDTLTMLRDKTKGNLSKRESDTLNAALYELQMKFVSISQKAS